jgi:hydroxyacylglutathione hydrolase
LSDEGPADWKYLYAKDYESQLLKEGDTFKVGNIRFDVLHTPGHTPESISFMLTDEGGGADKPMGIFTGDFVFVGSIGRPDLLEEAAGIVGSAEPGARELFHSAQRFKQLPDYLQIWPAHGAGSACGKGLGAIPSSTVGYEKMFNPALQFEDEQAFVDYILSEQPEAPPYFAIMKRVNKEGPQVLGEAVLPTEHEPAAIAELTEVATVLEVGSYESFGKAHVPGTIGISQDVLADWAGWLVDYRKPLYLVVSEPQLAEVTRVLRKIGVENIGGYFDPAKVTQADLRTESFGSATPDELKDRIAGGQVSLIDVRRETEWAEGHVDVAEHHFLGRLRDSIPNIDKSKPIVTQCRTGKRSAIAASLLQAAGVKDVINMTGGMMQWKQSGLPVVKDEVQVSVM